MLRHLILFDRVIVQSARLREFSVLGSTFGAQGLTALLRSGAVGILCDVLTTGQVGQSSLGGRARPLPPGSYSFRSVTGADRKAYLHRCFQNVAPRPGLTHKESKRLKHEIATRLVEPAAGVPKAMEQQLLADLRASAPHLATALSVELRRTHGLVTTPAALRLRVREIAEGDFRVESTLQRRSTLDEPARHKTVERALLAAGGLNQRIAQMNAYEAMTDFWCRDLSVLGTKLHHLHQLAPERLDRALATVLALPGLPDIETALARREVDVERLLAIRESREGQEFRRWFRGQGSYEFEALKEEWESLRSRLGAWITTPTGRTMRFLTSTGAGLVPGLGIATGAIDSFLLERWLPRSQPLFFLRHSYRSIFRRPA